MTTTELAEKEILENQKNETAIMEQVMVNGDLSKLPVERRLQYYQMTCKSLGLNPLTKPFGYILLNGKLTLYALKDCTDQLRSIKGVSITGLNMKIEDGLAIATATGKDSEGRVDCATGAVDVKNLFGEKKANAIMKAETKAKRRLTLSLCGLGILDESEAGSVEGARIVDEKVTIEVNSSDKAPVAPASTSTTPAVETPSAPKVSEPGNPAPSVAHHKPKLSVTTTTGAMTAERLSEIKLSMDKVYNDANLDPAQKRKAVNAIIKPLVAAKETGADVMEYYNSVMSAITSLEKSAS